MPVKHEIKVWKGNTLSVPMALSTKSNGVTAAVDLTGSEIVFKATWAGGTLRKSSETPNGLVIDDDKLLGKFTLNLSVEETRSLPQGAVRYEIERRIGGNQMTILYGDLIVAEWVNDD